jgi:putative transcriptional regulator
MRKIFIETGEFSEWVRTYLTDDDLAAMQRELMVDPEKGDVIPGCGGLRKLRTADPRRGRGKRGGARVIYLHIEERDRIHLITVYGKNQKDDLTAEDKKLYRQLVQVLKQQIR